MISSLCIAACGFLEKTHLPTRNARRGASLIRTFGFKTLSGSAVPAFGDVLTAAFNGSPNNSGCFSAEVADTSQYQVGDRLVFGAGQSGSNILLINEIVDSTNLLLSSEGDAPLSDWASGTTICLDVSCARS